MPQPPTDRPVPVAAGLDPKVGRLLCAVIGLRLQREFDADEQPPPRALIRLLREIRRREKAV